MHGSCATGVAVSLLLAAGSQAVERRRFSVDDLLRVRDLSDPQVSPDGAWVAYVVESTDVEKDEGSSDIWMTSWDGRRQLQLTRSEQADTTPRFSPDGRRLAFLSSRGEDASTQVWVLDLSGGESRALTDVPGEVEDFAWSPEGRRLALVVQDPKPRPVAEDAAPPPIVVDRYQFKQDGIGYLDARRSHVYLYDIESRKTEILTPGTTDEGQLAWSPDGKSLAFVSKRGGDPDRHWNWDVFLVEARAGAEARRLTAFDGSDAAPEYEGRPAFAPDGRSLAYLRSADASFESCFYGVPRLSTIAADGGEPRLLAADLDRSASEPRFSSDGRHLYFKLEDDRSVLLARAPVTGGPVERLTEAGRVVKAFGLGPAGKLAVLASRPGEAAEVFALEGGALRPLSRQNQALMAQLELGAVEEMDATSQDGSRVGSMLVKPPGFVLGRRYPTLLYIHGGPNMQDQHEFDAWAQLYAAQGYLVVQPNYRGSTGRGAAWAGAIVGDWGHLEVQDVIAALDAAVAKGMADPERLGVLGWSYGGMLTNYAIATDTRFKAASSGAGISNMLTGYGTDHYVVTYEHELGPPWKGIERYVKTSYPFLHADRIRTPTLFVCGQEDWNVPLVNSEQMYQALRSLGVDTRLVIYPGESHSIGRPSYLRDLAVRHLAWFGERLKP